MMSPPKKQPPLTVGSLTVTFDEEGHWTLSRRGQVLAEGEGRANLKDECRRLRADLAALFVNTQEVAFAEKPVEHQEPKPSEPAPSTAPEPAAEPPPPVSEQDPPRRPTDDELVTELFARGNREAQSYIQHGVWQGKHPPGKGELCTWYSGLDIDYENRRIIEKHAVVRPFRDSPAATRRTDARPWYVVVSPSRWKGGYHDVLEVSHDLAHIQARSIEAEKSWRRDYQKALSEMIDHAQRTRPRQRSLIAGLNELLQQEEVAIQRLEGKDPSPLIPQGHTSIAEPQKRARRVEPVSPLREIAEAYRKTAPEPVPEPPRPTPQPTLNAGGFWVAVRTERLFENDTGFVVQACSKNQVEVQAHVARNGPRTHAVWPHPFREALPVGQKLVARNDEHEVLKPLIRQARWEHEVLGQYARVVVWGLGQRDPQVNDLVKILETTGVDENKVPRHFRAVPWKYDPERDRHNYIEPSETIYAVVTRDKKIPAGWRIASLTVLPDKAVSLKQDLEFRAQEHAKVLDQKRWQTMSMTM